jgi:hypothetical protein
VELRFEGELIVWRGPSPFHFVPVPEEQSDAIDDVRSMVTYGWGVIPAEVRIGATTFRTSLFPKDGRYLVPVKDAVRRAERLTIGDHLSLTITLDV